MQLLRREHVPGPSRDSFKNARGSRLRACEVLAAGISRECEVDPHLAIARAKIDDAETFEEAAGFLGAREKFAALKSPAVLAVLFALPDSA